MHITKIISQHRRDFKAIFSCEHCTHYKESSGYDDEYFHNTVIPNMVCDKCGRKASKDYVAETPKYNSYEVV